MEREDEEEANKAEDKKAELKGKAKRSDPNNGFPEFSRHSNNSVATSIALSTAYTSKGPTFNDQIDVSTKNSNSGNSISITTHAVTPVVQGSNLDCEYISDVPLLKSQAPLIAGGTYGSPACEKGGGGGRGGLFSSSNSLPFPSPITNLVLGDDVPKSRTGSENDKQLPSTPDQLLSSNNDEKWAWPLSDVAERRHGGVLIEEIEGKDEGGGVGRGGAAQSLSSLNSQEKQNKFKTGVMQKTVKSEEKADEKDRNEENRSKSPKWVLKICPTGDTNNPKTSELNTKEVENEETLEPTTAPHTNTHIEPTTAPHSNTHIASGESSPPTKKHVFEKLSDVPAVRNYAEVEAAEKAMERVRGRDVQVLSEEDKVWKLAAEVGATEGVDGREREWNGGMDKDGGERLRERVREKLSDKTSLAF